MTALTEMSQHVAKVLRRRERPKLRLVTSHGCISDTCQLKCNLISPQGRSKSLTSIDALNPMPNGGVNMEAAGDLDCKSVETDLCSSTDRLQVPPMRCESAGPPLSGIGRYSAGGQRRRKLSTAGKVRSHFSPWYRKSKKSKFCQ